MPGWRRPSGTDEELGRTSYLLGTSLAKTEYLEIVSDLGEAMSTGRSLRPHLDFFVLDLDRETTPPAHEMMVVIPRSALTVDDFSITSAQYIQFTAVRHRLQVPVNSGEAHLAVALAQHRMDLLCAQKGIKVIEQRRDSGALTGRSRNARLRLH